ncbi:Sodium/potassium-transporting ATPase subunit beta-1 [Echinococcus granulosus]|nr:Sodium/potassium-transporting ATPase subunit beta-1 [Echinococcus granulosus]
MVRCSERYRNLGLAIFNPKEKKFCGRTCRSWALIFVYYLIFYSCLAGFWIGMLSVLIFAMIDTTVPSLTGMQSLLKLNPGLGILPPVDSEGTLIQLTLFDSKQKQDYLNFMQSYLMGYNNNSTNCDFENGTRINSSILEPCEFPLSLLGPCADPADYINSHNNFCFYLKLNKIYGYLPDIEGNKIPIQCGPANSFDGANLGQPVYYPSVRTANGTFGYFSSVAFPYLNQPHYQVPLLAVTFPDIKSNTVVMVSCAVLNESFALWHIIAYSILVFCVSLSLLLLSSRLSNNVDVIIEVILPPNPV